MGGCSLQPNTEGTSKTVIDGPGGPITQTDHVDEDALRGLLAYSPQARQVVLEELSARLRRSDLDLAARTAAVRWSEGVEDELLD